MTKILYIEDSAVNTYIIRKMIKSLGHEMISAYEGSEGIMLAEKCNPSLILIDLILPDIHGLEVIKHLRNVADFDDTPIIALTSTESPTMKASCIAAGCNDYLEKPVSQPRLNNAIETYLRISV